MPKFDVLLTVHLSIFVSVINQLDAQHFCFTISLFHASTCFEYMCSSSRGQNCITQPLVPSHLYVWCYQRQFWPPDDEHMCSKHVEAWNKLIVKQKFCASSWLTTEIKNGCRSFCCKICVVWAACRYREYISLVNAGAIFNNIEFYGTVYCIWWCVVITILHVFKPNCMLAVC